MIAEDMEGDRSAHKSILPWAGLLNILLCFLFTGNVFAQSHQVTIPINGENEISPYGNPVWAPPSAIPEKYDWIQLTSGEWLKGDLKALYEDNLEFDSEELELLELDWEDIKQVRGYKPHSVRLEVVEPMTVVGILKVIDDKVYITVEDEVLEFDRNHLISIAHETSERISIWSAKITISLDARKGNSDQVNYSSSAQLKRRTSGSRLFLSYRGVVSETEGAETANSQRINGRYDIFKSRKLFWRPLFFEYFRDPFSNIENRTNIGMGIGYHIIDTSKTEWDITPGLAYQYTENVSVEAGGDSHNATTAFEVETNYETELTKKIDLNAAYKFNVVNKESGKYSHHIVTTLEIELTHRLDLDVSLIWDRIQDPKLKDDGLLPKQDDYYFLFGISFEL
jgi:hypothetical protein